jgi:hypothetical protein
MKLKFKFGLLYLTGVIGFALSGLNNILFLTLVGALYSILLYPISIILRTLNWIILGRNSKIIFFFLTGILVFLFGAFTFMLAMNGNWGFIYSWIIYSILKQSRILKYIQILD